MIDFIKKSSAYFAGTLTFLIAIRASFGIATTWGVLAIIFSLAAIACITVAWFEVRGRIAPSVGRDRSVVEEGSVSLTLRRVFDTVKYSARDDESIALYANKIVRRGLDKQCIRYRDYRKWRQKNPAVFTAITGQDNELLGFFDIFPLTEEAAKGLLNGSLHEHELTVDSIVSFESNRAVRSIYIASIMANPGQKAFSQIVVREIVVLKCVEYLIHTFPPTDDRIVFAYAHTDLGERLLRNAAFTNTALSKDNKQRRPLYQLSPDRYKELAKTFARTSGIRTRSAREKSRPNYESEATR
ncbi:MAG: hypothetical protein ABFD89_01980 [Bryobacteraceae bacterium]